MDPLPQCFYSASLLNKISKQGMINYNYYYYTRFYQKVNSTKVLFQGFLKVGKREKKVTFLGYAFV